MSHPPRVQDTSEVSLFCRADRPHTLPGCPPFCIPAFEHGTPCCERAGFLDSLFVTNRVRRLRKLRQDDFPAHCHVLPLPLAPAKVARVSIAAREATKNHFYPASPSGKGHITPPCLATRFSRGTLSSQMLFSKRHCIGKPGTGIPQTALDAQNLPAQCRGAGTDAKAILPEPRSVKKANS